MTSKYEDLFHRDLLTALKAYQRGITLSSADSRLLVNQFVPAFFAVTANVQLADYDLVGGPMFDFLINLDDSKLRDLIVSATLEYLQHADPLVRNRAIEVLLITNATAPPIIAHLLYLLENDPDAGVRGGATKALSVLAPNEPQVLATLQLRLQQESSGYVRGIIVWALEMIGANQPTVLANLTETMQHDEDKIVRGYAAAAALVEAGADQAAVIQELLDNVRRGKDHWAAINWLGEMPQANNPEVISVLLNVLQHDSYEPNRWNAAKALATFAQTNEAVIPAVLDLLKQSNDEDTLDALIEGRLIYLLIGNNEAIPILLERIKLERDNEDDHARAAMIKLLIYISADRPNVVDTMLDVLQHDNGWMARLEAIHGLGELGAGDARVVAALLDELANQRRKDNVLEDTLYALAKVGLGVSAVVDAALDVLTQALVALPTLAEDETRPWMVEHLHDRNKQLRRASVYTLGAVGIASPMVRVALNERLNEDPDTWVRTTAAEALNKLGIKDEQIIMVLKQIISNDKSEVWRNDALSLLGRIASDREDVQQILYELAKSERTNPIHNTAFRRLYKAVVEDIEIGWPNL